MPPSLTAPPVASLFVAPIVRIRLRSLDRDRKLLALALLLLLRALTLLLWRGRREDRKGFTDVDGEIDDVNEETRNDNGSWEGRLLLLLLAAAAAAVPAPRRGRMK